MIGSAGGGGRGSFLFIIATRATLSLGLLLLVGIAAAAGREEGEDKEAAQESADAADDEAGVLLVREQLLGLLQRALEVPDNVTGER